MEYHGFNGSLLSYRFLRKRSMLYCIAERMHESMPKRTRLYAIESYFDTVCNRLNVFLPIVILVKTS